VDVVYNRNLVDPKELKSYWDLLNPKWKGKIEMFSNISAPHKFFYYHPDLGPKFLNRLFSEMQVTLSGNMHQIADWLGVGKFALAIAASQHTEVHKAQVQGLPIGLFNLNQFKEGVSLTSGTGAVALLKRAPHPNAAKVAVNWLLSREGQISFQKHFLNADSFRIDIPKDEIPPEFRRQDGIKYLDVDRLEFGPKPIRDLMIKFGAKPAR
jgi:iron(III) transport system substrate-binding protein